MSCCSCVISGYSRATSRNTSSQTSMVSGILKRVVHNPFRPFTCKDDRLDCHFFRCSLMHAPSYAGVLAFRILTDTHQINFPGTLVCQWTPYTWQQTQRPEVDVLVKLLTDGQQQPPQRDVVRNPRISNGT